jgi:hypothetical protein
VEALEDIAPEDVGLYWRHEVSVRFCVFLKQSVELRE